MTKMLMGVLALFAAFAVKAQDVSGDWQGTLQTGGAELHLLVHVSRTLTGALQATMDSLDQSATGIPISSIALNGSKLTFASEAVHGSYEGTLNADGASIQGTWTQGAALALNLTRAVRPSEIDGTWQGTLDAGSVRLRVILHLTSTKDGLAASMESPDQGVKGVPVSLVKRDASTLTLEMPALRAEFEGVISKDLSTIEGTFTQGGASLPLALKRGAVIAVASPLRPQNPVKPYPYREEDVTYENQGASIRLAGTLTIPRGKGPFPAVALITGSGPHDRDETIMNHKPFLVLSDYLTRRGIAVLRTDKRGVGKSGGDLATATTADFATDTEAAIAYLKTRSEVDAHKIGLIGHSEGGVIAPMVAARDKGVAFIVLIAGPGVPGDQIIVAQVIAGNEAAGMSHEQARQAGQMQRKVLDLVEQEKDEGVLKQKLRALLGTAVPDTNFETVYRQLTSSWYRYFLTYDPAPALRKLTCPVLVVNGSKDTQVPPEQNLAAIRKALEAGGNKHFEAVELLGLNHLLQTAKTGAVSEYARIDETISPIALEKITSWLLNQ